MRIAIVHWSNRQVGGTGTYLTTVIPYLRRAGHELALWHEVDSPRDDEPLPMSAGTPVWNVEALGLETALAGLREWKPDLLYSHGLRDPLIEQETLDVAPAVFFAHDYYGTCISGAKSFKNPTIQPCDRTFGWPCLVQYYPRRCGGWSPVSMVREFRKQASRLDLLQRYGAIVTLSRRMQDEYLRHGLRASRVFDIESATGQAGSGSTRLAAPQDPNETPQNPRDQTAATRTWRLLFVGRMYQVKGGREMLQALPIAARALDCRLHVTFAGDGAERAEWERVAASICAGEPRVSVNFAGWVSRDAVGRLLDQADLLVVPSLWPEPFGLVGLEAAQHRVPVAAFAVGGIPDWLHSGVNGHLAPADPPTVEGLAEAIISCLRDEETHSRLRDGAGRMSTDNLYDGHAAALLDIFADVARLA